VQVVFFEWFIHCIHDKVHVKAKKELVKIEINKLFGDYMFFLSCDKFKSLLRKFFKHTYPFTCTKTYLWILDVLIVEDLSSQKMVLDVCYKKIWIKICNKKSHQYITNKTHLTHVENENNMHFRNNQLTTIITSYL
jgi:hypothetical protein